MFLNDIKHDWIGKVPSHWDVKRVKHLFHIKQEISENPEDEEVLSLTFGGIIKRDITTNEGQLPATYNGYTKIYPDDIVMNPMDLRAGWVDRSKYEGIISPSYYVLNRNTESTDIRYFNYQFQRHYKERIFFSFGQGVSYDYRWGIGKETLLNFPIIVPPPSEQNKIANYLDHKTKLIESLIDKKQKLIELLKEKRTSFINHCVTKGLNPNVEMKDSGVEWIGEIPISWDLRNGSTIGSYSKGKGIRKDEVVEFGEACVRYGEIYTKYELKIDSTSSFISEETSLNSVFVNSGTLLLTGSGETKDEIGKCIVYLGEEILWVGGDIIILEPNENINSLFLSYLMYSECIRIQREISGRGDIIVHIYSKNFKEMKFPIPSINEQHQIVEYLDEQTQKIDSTIEKEIKRIELLKEYRTALISEAVTGKIDVREEVLA